DGLAPAAMATFERLAHDFGVADAFEGVVRATIGELDNMGHDMLDLVGIDEVGHPELARHGFALGVQIHPNDLVCAHHLGALYDVQPDPAQPEHHHVGARLDLGGQQDRANACGDTATDVADLVKR